MSKIIYLSNYLQKLSKTPGKGIDLEDIEGIARYDDSVDEDKKITKIFVECFKNKKTYKELLNKLPDDISKKERFYLITAYWFSYINYYHHDTFVDEVNICLNNIDEEAASIVNPNFCKKVYYYLMKPVTI